MRHIAALLLLTAAVAAGAQTMVEGHPCKSPSSLSFVTYYDGKDIWLCGVDLQMHKIQPGGVPTDNAIFHRECADDAAEELAAKDAEIAKLKRQLAAARKRADRMACDALKAEGIFTGNCQPPNGPGSR
jgi:hypothetical protein